MEIIADCNLLLGQSNNSVDKAQEYTKRFESVHAKRQYIQKSISNNNNYFLCTYNHDLLKSLNRTGAKIYPVVPNASQYVRDMNNYGPIGMGIKKLAQLGFGMFQLIPSATKNGIGVLGNNFSNIISLLTEIEMVKFRKFRPEIAFLHPQMADLFLANDAYMPIKSFSDLIRKKYGMEAGIFTNNISKMLGKLDEWDSDIKHVCTPLNPRGYMMKPNKKTAEKSIRQSKREIIGYDATCGGTIDIEEAKRYVKSLGVGRIVVEMDFG